MEILILILILLLWVVPLGVIIIMANSKGRSKHFAWWGVFLGWLGFIIAAIIIAAGADRRAAS